MMFDPAPAARALLEARRTRTPAGPLPSAIVPGDEAQGAAVQRALAGLLAADPPGGFKIGATAPAMRAYLGLSGPIAGFMRAEDIHASGASLPFAGFRGLGVECEIGVRLARALPPGPCTPAEARDAVGEMFAAIELVENRYGPPPAGDLVAVGVPTLLADQMFHAGAVIGTPAAGWQGLDLESIPGRISIDGAERAAGQGSALLGHPMQALAWLAGSVTAAAFGGLQAGQVVMLGSVTPPIWLEGPCRVEVAFTGLGRAKISLS